MKEYTDREIIDCLRNRDGYVVGYLIDRYLPMVRLMVFQSGGTGEDARDIFQDALLIILKKIDEGELELSCKFRTFVYCICDKLWKSVQAKRYSAMNYFVRRVEPDDEKDFTEFYDNKLYEHMFYDLFEKLDPVCRSILRLYWQELSPREIAEKLGYTYGYVRKKKSDCQGELIARVNRHPEYRKIRKTEKAIETVVRE